MHAESKEDEEGTQRQTKVKATRGYKVQTTPPPEMPLLYPVLENEAHDSPGEVIQGCGGRYRARAAEYQGRHDVFEWGFGIALGAKVDGDGDYGAENEEEEEGRVDAARGEHAIWADEAPDDRGWRLVR